MTRRQEEGFTLVELLVSMLCVSIIMVAVMSWLLMGIRVEKSAADTMERQQKTRVVLSLLESMTASGKVSKVQETGAATVGEGEEPQHGAAGFDWALLDDSNRALIRYRAGSGSIVTGSGDVLMGDLEYASATFDPVKDMFRIVLKSDGQEYSSQIFCRKEMGEMSYGVEGLLEEIRQKNLTTSSRYAFLTLLTSQLGSSGEIIDKADGNNGHGHYMYDYFTECYLQNSAGNRDQWSLTGSGTGMNWSPKTPWCATYVSWALLHMNHNCFDNDDLTLAYIPLFADVNDGRELFHEQYELGSGFSYGGYNTGIKDPNTDQFGAPSGTPGNGMKVLGKDHPTQKVGKWIDTALAQETPEAISPGDLIFFDWGEVGTSSGVIEGDGSLDHVGVVLYMTEDQIFTIEGNTDGKVAMRNYAMSDPAIVGYGLLDWRVD